MFIAAKNVIGSIQYPSMLIVSYTDIYLLLLIKLIIKYIRNDPNIMNQYIYPTYNFPA